MTNICLIGLGKMGAAIATRILELGHPLTLYNRTLSKIDPFVKKGAHKALSIKEAVGDADIIISCLLNDKALIDMSLTDSGIIANMKSSAIHIGTATILPETAHKIFDAHQAAGKHYLSAAVLGVPSVALHGELTTFCAGSDELLKACIKTLYLFSNNVIPMGEDPKAPLVMKISMNYALITSLELMSELYVFAEKSGLPLEALQKGLHHIYGHPAFKRYIDKIKDRNFDEVNFDMSGGLKDVSIFQQAFTDVGVVPKLANLAKERYISALANGMKDKDWSGIYEVVRKEAGLD